MGRLAPRGRSGRWWHAMRGGAGQGCCRRHGSSTPRSRREFRGTMSRTTPLCRTGCRRRSAHPTPCRPPSIARPAARIGERLGRDVEAAALARVSGSGNDGCPITGATTHGSRVARQRRSSGPGAHPPTTPMLRPPTSSSMWRAERAPPSPAIRLDHFPRGMKLAADADASPAPAHA